MRSSRIESYGLRHLLNYDGIFHWHGSASNGSGPAVGVANNLVSLCVRLLPCIRVLCANERQLPAIAAAYAPVYGPTTEQASDSHLIRQFHEWNRDPRTRKARAPPLAQQALLFAWLMSLFEWLLARVFVVIVVGGCVYCKIVPSILFICHKSSQFFYSLLS